MDQAFCSKEGGTGLLSRRPQRSGLHNGLLGSPSILSLEAIRQIQGLNSAGHTESSGSGLSSFLKVLASQQMEMRKNLVSQNTRSRDRHGQTSIWGTMIRRGQNRHQIPAREAVREVYLKEVASGLCLKVILCAMEVLRPHACQSLEWYLCMSMTNGGFPNCPPCSR